MFLPWVKWPDFGVDHALSYRAEYKERVELYLYSTNEFHGLFYGEIYFFTFTGLQLS
jgi:hypothetical protein